MIDWTNGINVPPLFGEHIINLGFTHKKGNVAVKMKFLLKEIVIANRWTKATAMVVNILNSYLLELVQWIYRCWALFVMENWISNQVMANGLFYMPMFNLN